MPKFTSDAIPNAVRKHYVDMTYKQAITLKGKQVDKWRRILDRSIKAWKEDFPRSRDYMKDNAIKKLWWKVEYLKNQQFAMEQEDKEDKANRRADYLENID